MDGSETDVDCGGEAAPPCKVNSKCRVNTDCRSGYCYPPLKRCANSCNDRLKNGLEADIDCGGVCKKKCPIGKRCILGSDCATGICGTNKKCSLSSCSDKILNGNETDIDCGGKNCKKCTLHKSCQKNSDCASNQCGTMKICIREACSNGIKDGYETDVDCGGQTCSPCNNLKQCKKPRDCSSLKCLRGKCAEPTCSDGVRNGNEKGVDCGAECPTKCSYMTPCTSNEDCNSGVCGNNKKCSLPRCDDGVRNGGESDTDCGGKLCAGCKADQICSKNTDCESKVCTAKRCAPPTCVDAVQNGNETDIDCGGTECPGCLLDQRCNVASDCLPAEPYYEWLRSLDNPTNFSSFNSTCEPIYGGAVTTCGCEKSEGCTTVKFYMNLIELDDTINSGELDTSECFPATALVQMNDGSMRTMLELQVGDEVRAVDSQGLVTASPIYVFPHAIQTGMYRFIKVTLASNQTITATPDHYFIVSQGGGGWSHKKAVTARDVKVGDSMWIITSHPAHGNERSLQLSQVTCVESVMAEGIYSPFTLTGTIIVNGVVASVYNDMLGNEYAMHAFCAWGRWLWRVAPGFFSYMHRKEWASPLALIVGRAAAGVLRLTSLS